jgi:xanthine dehydrogenase YagS FAD-binding subunit
MNNFEYLVAPDTKTAIAAIADKRITLKAGGIDLLDRMKERIDEPGIVLSIDRIESLKFIKEEAGGLRIGALTTLADLSRSDVIKRSYTALWDAAAHAATPQIRERATVGGNLAQRPRCWYFRNHEFHCLKKGGATCFAVEGENRYHAIFGGGPCHIVHPSNIAPALVALGAQITVEGKSSKRQVDAEGFFILPQTNVYAENVLRPGEMITDVLIPIRPNMSATIELREKQSFDWPIAIASVAQVFDEKRITKWNVCLGAVAPTPWRSRSAIASLQNSDITLEIATRAGEAAIEEAKPMRDNAYKIQLVKVAVKRALLKAAGIEENA